MNAYSLRRQCVVLNVNGIGAMSMPPRRLAVVAIVAVTIAAAGAVVAQQRGAEAGPRKMAAGAPATAPAESADARAVRADLEAYVAAVAKKDFKTVAGYVDAERMVQEIEAAGMLAKMSGAQRARLVSGIEGQIEKGIRDPANVLAMTVIRVKKVHVLAGGREAMVYLKGAHASEAFMARWWMVKSSSGRWRTYDVEDASRFGVRLSMVMCGAVATTDSGFRPAAWVKDLQEIEPLLKAQGDGDVQKVEQMLPRLEKAGFPPGVQAMVLTVKGITLATQQKNAEAEAAFAQAARLDPDEPMALYLRATMYNVGMQKPEKGAELARQFLDRLGDDAMAFEQLAIALRIMHRDAEAIEALGRGNDDAPAEIELLAGYANWAAAAQPEDVTRRIERALSSVADPKAATETLAEDMGNRNAMDCLIAAYKKAKPGDAQTLAKLEEIKKTIPPTP